MTQLPDGRSAASQSLSQQENSCKKLGEIHDEKPVVITPSKEAKLLSQITAAGPAVLELLWVELSSL